MPPKDTRRLPVPDDSRPPYPGRIATGLVNDKGLRGDGRQQQSARTICTEVGNITSARGSAFVEMNRTKVICAVYGPREIVRRDEFSLKGHLLCELKFATFCSRFRRQHRPDADGTEYSAVIQEALEPAVILEKFPKCRLDIYITVLEDDGSVLAAALTCASLALAHAGIEMYDIVIGASLRRLNDVTLVDPTANEERHTTITKSATIDCSLTIGYMPSLRQITAFVQEGTSDETNNRQCMNICIEMCRRVHPIVRQCLVDSVKEGESVANGNNELKDITES